MSIESDSWIRSEINLNPTVGFDQCFIQWGGHGPFRPLGDQFCPPENYDFCALYYAFAPPKIGLRPPGDSFRPLGGKNLDKTL